jgi:phosphoglycolate phosphatase-like HAD superfamily hydrolase
MSERSLAVVDIDGVVADVRHRLHLLERRPRDWDAFFAAADADPPHAVGVELVQRLAEEHEVVFLTGRPRRLEQATRTWLQQHGIGGHRLLMRPEGDRRPAPVTKLAMLRRLADEGEVYVVVDDDVHVIEAVSAAGFPTFHADWEQRSTSDQDALEAAQDQLGRT